MRTAVVIGAGIGGLTAAAALARTGWSVTVLERAAALQDVGAGLAVAPNALKALDAVGLGDAVRARAAIQGEAGLRRADGRWIYRTSGASIQARFGDPVVVIARSELIGLLAARAPDGALRLGHAVTAVHPGDAGTTARVDTQDGGSYPADLVVAADGVRSATRRAVFPGHPGPVLTGMTAWRFLAAAPAQPFPPDQPLVAGETWGRGAVFGAMPLADGRVYCYAAAPTSAGPDLPDLFGSWHDPIPALMAGVAAADVSCGELCDFTTALPAFHHGRIALLGDAAHPMTPFLGQGACQAIEDAVTLAALLARHELPSALTAYTAARLPRTTTITRRSRRVANLIMLTSPLTAGLRDGALSALTGLLGSDRFAASFDSVFGWTPEATTRP